MKTLRIGTVPYLNIEPFVLALREVVPCEVVRRHPSSLLELARTSDLDLCMLSAVDLIDRGVEPLGGASIASDGAVKSVLLLGRPEPATWTRVALDGNSRTSNRLASVLLNTLVGTRPRTRVVTDPYRELRSGSADAAVLIGDRALRAQHEGTVWDLGELWQEITGHSFVYAAWTRGRRRTVSARVLEEILAEARRGSRGMIDRCVKRARGRWCLEPASVRDYLEKRISYRFDASERAGLLEFGSRLRSSQLAPALLVGAGGGQA